MSTPIPTTRPPARRVLVPDLDGEPLTYLIAVEKILLSIGLWEDRPDDPDLPAALSGPAPIEAVRRLQDVLRPTQGIGVLQGRMLAPLGHHRAEMPALGHYEHTPLTEITVAVGDVQALAAIAAELGRPGLDYDISDVVEAHAPHGGSHRVGAWLPELVEQLARLAGVLDLAWTPDTDLIAPRARERARGSDVFLTDDEEAAYQRLADRLNTIASDDAITRGLY